jgi:hypothetical protein
VTGVASDAFRFFISAKWTRIVCGRLYEMWWNQPRCAPTPNANTCSFVQFKWTSMCGSCCSAQVGGSSDLTSDEHWWTPHAHFSPKAWASYRIRFSVSNGPVTKSRTGLLSERHESIRKIRKPNSARKYTSPGRAPERFHAPIAYEVVS